MGVANPGGAVTVNGHAALRQGEYFHHALAVANSSQPWHGTVQVSSAYPPGAVESGAVFVPRTPESFSHDADGNLTHDGQWVYTWDAENRLVRMVSANTNPAVGPQQRIEFGYDWHGRRISKRVWNNTSGTGAPALDLKFVYDLSAGPAGGVEFAGHSGFSLQPSEFVCVGSGFERHDGRGGGRGRFAVRDRAYGSECGNLFLRV
jgi:YD repeat-containing protein